MDGHTRVGSRHGHSHIDNSNSINAKYNQTPAVHTFDKDLNPANLNLPTTD